MPQEPISEEARMLAQVHSLARASVRAPTIARRKEALRQYHEIFLLELKKLETETAGR